MLHFKCSFSLTPNRDINIFARGLNSSDIFEIRTELAILLKPNKFSESLSNFWGNKMLIHVSSTVFNQ